MTEPDLPGLVTIIVGYECPCYFRPRQVKSTILLAPSRGCSAQIIATPNLATVWNYSDRGVVNPVLRPLITDAGLNVVSSTDKTEMTVSLHM